MTTLLSWVSFSDTGQDAHLPRAVYLASDSRITWGSADRRWEAGRKVFAPTKEPHLFGFCGDVILPALILGEIVSAIDAGILFAPDASANDRHQAVLKAVERGLARAVETPTLDFTIHHLLREGGWPTTSFRAWNISYQAGKRVCSSAETDIPKATEIIASFGSGHHAAKTHYNRWQETEAAGRSRAILASFCDSIQSGDDPLSGGPPQLVALYTRGGPSQIGMYVDGRAFMNGLEVAVMPSLNRAEWRDSLGQQVDPLTGKRGQGARRFGRPNKLGKTGT